MVALVRAIGLVNKSVVLDEIGIPLICFATKETIVAVETLLQGPLLPTGTRCYILLGHVVILSDPERAPARILKNLSDGGALWWKAAMCARKPARGLSDGSHAVEVMVASGQ